MSMINDVLAFVSFGAFLLEQHQQPDQEQQHRHDTEYHTGEQADEAAEGHQNRQNKNNRE